MSFDTSDLIRLSIRLDRAADVADAEAKDHDLHGEQPQAAQKRERAHSGRLFANVCRDAVQEIKDLRSKLADKRARQAKKVRVGDAGSAFECFWKIYPNRKAKGDAKRAWIAMKCDDIAEKIMEGLKRAIPSNDWTKDQGCFIPHPATWLRREGWDDDYKSGAVSPLVKAKDQDPERWREFLRVHGRDYEPHRFAMEFLRADFIEWARKTL